MHERVEQRHTDEAAADVEHRHPRPRLQAKLVVGSADDPLEREADCVADEVMALLQRTDDGARPAGPEPGGPTRISRHTGHPGHEHGRPEVGADGGDISPGLSSRIRARTGGAPLGEEVRTRMERGFGADFGAVRIHAASPLPAEVSAHAFTVGSRIHFAPGLYEPSSRAGQRLLSHELAHVVQQGGATAYRHVAGDDHENVARSIVEDITPADTGGTVRRHSSWEHMLIGDLDPDALATVGAAYDIGGSATKQVEIGKDVNNTPIMVGKGEVQHVIQQEIDRLKLFQAAPPMIDSMGQAYEKEQKAKRMDPTWDVRLVGVPNDAGKTFLVTYGELNTLADYFGSIEEMKAMDPVWVDKLIRGVRQSTMRELIKVYAAVTGLRDDVEGGPTKEDKAKARLGVGSDTFKSVGGSADAVEIGGGGAVGVANELKLMGAIPSFFAKPTVGGDASTDYASTLGRNACHFAPESWHAWAGYHEKARALADQAYKMVDRARTMFADINSPTYSGGPKRRARDEASAKHTLEAAYELRNEALLNNGFGDHYLQDSYAAGHLINKTRIMQLYVKWLDKHPDKWDAHRDKNWRKIQQMAYHQPGLTDPGQYTKANIGQPRQTSSGRSIETARNPQTVENIQGGWKDKAEALGLVVPPSVRDANAKALLVEWQTMCVNQAKVRNPRVQTVTTLLSMGSRLHLSPANVWTALNALFKDGIIRKESYDASDLTKQHVLDQTDKLTLREEYVPSSTASLARSQASQGAFEDMTLGVAYNDYLDFMNSSFLQKATNFLHNHWCEEGLDVETDDGTPVFRVYGDDAMFKQGASKGLKHSGETAHRSRNAIIQIANTGNSVDTTQDILRRLPSKVQIWSGASVGLDVWESAKLNDALGASLFEKMSDAGNVIINKLIVGAKPGLKGAGLLGTISKDPRPGGHDIF